MCPTFFCFFCYGNLFAAGLVITEEDWLVGFLKLFILGILKLGEMYGFWSGREWFLVGFFGIGFLTKIATPF